MRIKKIILFIFVFCLFLQSNDIFSQSEPPADKFNPIITASPFLSVSTDTRGKSMGDAGVATTPNVFSVYYNPSKYAYAESDFEVGVSYTPWLRRLAKDISFSNLSVYKRLGKQVLATSLRYFNMGEVNYTDNMGMDLGNYRSYDLAWDFSYASMLTPNLAMAITARYIRSALIRGRYSQNEETSSGNAVAADISLYQQIPLILGERNATIAWGINISNIGSKISYYKEKTHKQFIPAVLRFGPAFTYEIDKQNKVTLGLDITKTLVPSRYGGTKYVNENEAKLSEISSISGIFRSFVDAPGGFSEEIREFNIGMGTEYIYKKIFALRGGFFHEDKTKGLRSYLALGAGFTYHYFNIDLGYMVPVNAGNSLSHSISVALSFDVEKVFYKKSLGTDKREN